MTSKQPGQPPRKSADRPEIDTAYSASSRGGGSQRQGIAEAAIKAFIRSIAGSLGRAITRAIVGRR